MSMDRKRGIWLHRIFQQTISRLSLKDVSIGTSAERLHTVLKEHDLHQSRQFHAESP